MQGKERPSNQERLAEAATALEERFIMRRDLYAKQLDDGSYVCVHRPLTRYHLVSHLEGKLTLGNYVFDEHGNGSHLVFDADDEPDWRRLRALSHFLADEGTASYLERSRRGGHLWLFFDERQPGSKIRLFGNGLLYFFNIENIELYPRQGELTTGPGSLVRLPFGIHQKSGRRYGFYLPSGEPLAPTLSSQIVALRDAQTIQKSAFDRFVNYAEVWEAESRFQPSETLYHSTQPVDESAPVSERLKASVMVREFVGLYVELSESGKGLCPFHDDHIASFSVSEEGNFWHCFACNIGGSIIDFWMQWRQCDFRQAVRELADKLL